MAGSNERNFNYRPRTTDKKIDKYVLIATAVERERIYADVTRLCLFWGSTSRAKGEDVCR